MILRLLFLFASLVFPPRGQAAANVPLRFVLFQNAANLFKQHRIDPAQSLRKILVYSRFADAEFCRRRPNRSIVFNHIETQLLSAIFDLIMQIPSLPRYSCIMYMSQVFSI